MFCLEPLVMAGYLFMSPVSYRHEHHLDYLGSHEANLNAAMVEVQTCDRGAGLDLKAAQSGVYGMDAQYGFQWREGAWSFTLTPKLGGAYHDVQILEEQSKLTFGLGASAMVGYGSMRASFEYWHNSNAGLGDHNSGLDMLCILGGWKFN